MEEVIGRFLVGIVVGAGMVYGADRVKHPFGLWALRIGGLYIAWASLASMIGVGLQYFLGDNTDAYSVELGLGVATGYGGAAAAVLVALIFFLYRREQATRADADA